jgi:hypothetical protein
MLKDKVLSGIGGKPEVIHRQRSLGDQFRRRESPFETPPNFPRKAIYLHEDHFRIARDPLATKK